MESVFDEEFVSLLDTLMLPPGGNVGTETFNDFSKEIKSVHRVEVEDYVMKIYDMFKKILKYILELDVHRGIFIIS